MVEQILHNNKIYAIIIRSDYKGKDIQFFTPDDFSQQLGYMNRPQGYVIEPHRHIPVDRTVRLTQEVLVVKTGKIKVIFFDEEDTFCTSTIIHQGDVILLAEGGHGFEMLEDSELIEIKQGPYQQKKDKILLFPEAVKKTGE